MLAKNNSKLSFSINNILNDEPTHDAEIIKNEDRKIIEPRFGADQKVSDDQTEIGSTNTRSAKRRIEKSKENEEASSKCVKSIGIKPANEEFQNLESIDTMSKSEDNYDESIENENNNADNDDDDDDDDQYDEGEHDEIDGETSRSSHKSENLNRYGENQDTSLISSQYKHLQEYYQSLCRNQPLLLSSPPKPDISNPTLTSHFTSMLHENGPADAQSELSKNIFRLLLASSSSSSTGSVATNQSSIPSIHSSPSSSSTSIYSNLLLQWLGSIQAATNHMMPPAISASNSDGIGPHQALHQQSFSALDLTHRNLLESGHVSDVANLLEQKSHNYQKRIGHPYQNRNPPKRKKPRTSFNRPQIVELEKRFMKQKYLASSERSTLAKLLKMTDAQVKTWFQNRRTKWRRQNAEEKQAERQATNKLLMTLKQQQQQQQQHQLQMPVPTKTNLNVTSSNNSNGSISGIDLSQFSSNVSSLASVGSSSSSSSSTLSSSSSSSSVGQFETSSFTTTNGVDSESSKNVGVVIDDNDQMSNPLNKLIMMEKVFAVAAAAAAAAAAATSNSASTTTTTPSNNSPTMSIEKPHILT